MARKRGRAETVTAQATTQTANKTCNNVIWFNWTGIVVKYPHKKLQQILARKLERRQKGFLLPKDFLNNLWRNHQRIVSDMQG